jgi:hypothetical protein
MEWIRKLSKSLMRPCGKPARYDFTLETVNYSLARAVRRLHDDSSLRRLAPALNTSFPHQFSIAFPSFFPFYFCIAYSIGQKTKKENDAIPTPPRDKYLGMA